MSIKERYICRLCLKVAKTEFVIDEIVKQMLEILLLNMDLEITGDSIICQDCMEVAKKCLNFKSTCINTEQIILSYSLDRREVKHNIKVIYGPREYMSTVPDEDFNICRFCMTQFESKNFVSLDTLTNESIFDMVSQVMAEMDLNAIENALVCTNCREALEIYFNFVLNCLSILKINVDVFLPKKYYEETKSDIIFLNTTIHNNEEYSYQENVQANITDKPNRKKNVMNDAAEGSMQEYMLCTSKVKRVLKNRTRSLKGTSELKQKNRGNRPTNNKLDPQSSVTVDRDVHKIKMYKCSLCAYESKQKCNLRSHMIVHKDFSEVKVHQCSLCTYETKYKGRLNGHMLVHKDVSEIEMHKCPLCTFQSKFKYNLPKHMLVHKDISEIETYKCSLCAYEAKQKSCLTSHMLVHKEVPQIMQKCSLCAFESKHKNSLTRHMLVHKDVSEVEMYKCLWCAYETKQRRYLNAHMLVHKDISKVKTYKCSLCAYETKQKYSLPSHMLVHKDVSKIKMYKCSLCDYEAKYKGNLNKHMLVHRDVTDVKMYTCSLCPYETKRKSALTKHMLVHKNANVPHGL